MNKYQTILVLFNDEKIVCCKNASTMYILYFYNNEIINYANLHFNNKFYFISYMQLLILED